VVSFTPPFSFLPKKTVSGTHRIGGCVGLRAGSDDMEKTKYFILYSEQTNNHNIEQTDKCIRNKTPKKKHEGNSTGTKHKWKTRRA
jgi:hypothetical protein